MDEIYWIKNSRKKIIKENLWPLRHMVPEQNLSVIILK